MISDVSLSEKLEVKATKEVREVAIYRSVRDVCKEGNQ